MKHLYEYEDSDVRDLMQNLKDIGINDLQSVFIQTISKGEESFDCWILVGKDEEQMVEMLLDDDMVSPIPVSLRSRFSGTKTLSDLFLSSSNLRVSDSDLIHFTFFRDLELRPSVKEPMLVCFHGNEFYRSINLLETYYTNIQDVMYEKLRADWGNNLYVQKWGK